MRAPNERAALLTFIIAIALLIVRGPLLHRLSAFSLWYTTRLDALPLLAKCNPGGIVALLYQLGDHHTLRSGSSAPPSLHHPRDCPGGCHSRTGTFDASWRSSSIVS